MCYKKIRQKAPGYRFLLFLHLPPGFTPYIDFLKNEFLIKIRRKSGRKICFETQKNDFFEISKNRFFLLPMALICYFLQNICIKEKTLGLEGIVGPIFYDQNLK